MTAAVETRLGALDLAPEAIVIKPGNRFAVSSVHDQVAYDRAISQIKARLGAMDGKLKGVIRVSLGSSSPQIIIDGREGVPKLLEHTQDSIKEGAVVEMSPLVVERLYSGTIDSRYAVVWGGRLTFHGDRKLATRFTDHLSPTPPTIALVPKGRLPEPTEDLSQIRSDLAEFGFGLIKGALKGEELAKVKNRLMDQAAAEAVAGFGAFDGGPNKPNQRVWNLPQKGQTFLDLLDHPLIDELIPPLLGDDPILFSYTANISRPGSVPMYGHTDQISLQPQIRDFPMGFNIMWFLSDMYEENGSTRVIPKSHHGNVAPADIYDMSESVFATGKAGDAMIFDSRLWHATGANTTKDVERPVILTYFVRNWIRSQDNWQICLSPDVEAKLTDRQRTFLGYRCTGSLGGQALGVEDKGRKTNDGEFSRRLTKYVGELSLSNPPSLL